MTSAPATVFRSGTLGGRRVEHRPCKPRCASVTGSSFFGSRGRVGASRRLSGWAIAGQRVT